MGRFKFKILLIFIILIIILPFTRSAIDPETRAYFDAQNQKVIAQLTAKIDSKSNRVEKSLQDEIQKAEEDLNQRFSDKVKSELKAVAIGLGGILLLFLSLFKIIEFRLSHDKKIKAYEKDLKKRIEKLDNMIIEVESLKLVNTQPPVPKYEPKIKQSFFKKKIFIIPSIIILTIVIISTSILLTLWVFK